MLLDTSGFFTLFDVRESHHALARELYEQATTRFTTNYVLVEFVSLVIARCAKLEEALRFIERLPSESSVELVWVTEDLHTAAMDLLRRRRDKTYSLCDAVSFVLMEDREFTEALTTDKSFRARRLRSAVKIGFAMLQLL